MKQNQNHYIILVHGTWARRKDAESVWYVDDGAKNNFCRKLNSFLAGTELEGAIWRKCTVVNWPFVWSGNNTHESRLEAARDLYACIKQIVEADENARLHFVAHSHGGNVLLAAIDMYLRDLDWQARGIYITLSLLHWHLDARQSPRDKRSIKGHANGDASIEVNGHQSVVPFVLSDRWSGPVSDWEGGVREELRAATGERWALALQRQGLLIDQLRSELRTREPLWERRESLLDQMRGPVDMILERFVARWKGNPEWNRLGRLVFMGTPFLRKMWPRRIHTVSRVALALPMALLGTLYFPGIPLAVVLILYLLIARPGLSPFGWHWLIQLTVVLSLVAGVMGWLPRMTSGRRCDTNLYFREHKAYAGMHSQDFVGNWVEPPLKSLVVYAGPIDEALLALSAEPLAYGSLFPVVEKMVFMKPHQLDEVSDEANTPIELTQYIIRITQLWFKKSLYWVTEKPLRPIRRLVTLKAAEVLTKILSSAAYGTRPEEMNGATVHVSSSAGVSQAFQETMWNVAKYLLESHAEEATAVLHDSQRYQFLWDGKELEKRAQASPLWNRVSGQLKQIRKRYSSAPLSSLTEQLIKTCITLEEKQQELAGAIDLKHSTYYTNDFVIRGIAEFLTNGCLPKEV